MTRKNYESQRKEKLVGLEIEFFGVDKDTVVAKLNEAGIGCSYMGYTHRTVQSWKLVSDVSVNGQGTGIGRGLELVSPPLTIAKMEKDLKTVTTVLNELGAKVDRSCGIHVHHEIDDLNAKHIKNIFATYYRHQNMISEMMPKSRRNGHYCQDLTRNEVERILSQDTIRDIQYTACARYRVINFTSYVKYGTVEFRQHGGSTDFEKIFNWILITQAIVASSKAKGNRNIGLDLPQSYNPTMQFNKEIGVFKTVQGAYTRDRKRELLKKYTA